MNAATLQPRPWTRRRWGTLFVMVFGLHLGLIFALSDRKPLVPRPPAAAPVLRLAAPGDELVEFNDPTLFALPHRRGFAGAVWQRDLNGKPPPFRWSESPHWLTLPEEKLGATFARFMQTNLPAPFELEIKPAPELILPVTTVVATDIIARSTLRLTGELTNRRLLNPPELPLQPWTDLLTSTVVQVLVSADGKIISPPVLLARCGSEPADHFALGAARALRFEPLRNGTTKRAVGTLIFEWYTVPLTNAPASPQ